MNPSRFLVLLPRLRAVAALAVLLAAPYTFAAKKVVADVTGQFSFMVYYGANNSFSLSNQEYLYDDDLTTSANANGSDRFFIASATFTDAEPAMYVDEIRFDLPDTSTLRYSLYVSTNYNVSAAQSAVWSALASNVETTESASFEIKDRIKAVKFVFENGSPQTALAEFHVTGFRSSIPKVVSSYAIATFYNASGGVETGEFGGGNNSFWGSRTPGQQLFNGNFNDNNMWPKAPDGGYVAIEFTSTNGEPHLPEYYVTEIWVGSTGTKKFTLGYSEDGTTWNNVDGAVGVKYNGIGKYAVGKTAKKVRYVWTEGSMWDYSTEYLAEVQVWGMDPDDVPCTHPSFTDWEETIPATCTERAQLTRNCTVCGQQFAKYSDAFPLGHDYVTTLDRSGMFSRNKDFPDHRRYGAGSITCSRCGFRLDFPTALDLVTNRVGGKVISGVKTEGIVRFTDAFPSSENHPEWGPGFKKVLDGVWGTTYDNGGYFEWPYWTTTSTNAYADFEFGTAIDLTAVEFSVYNHGYHLEFCSIDDDSGDETKFGDFSVVKDETVIGTKIVTVVDPDTGLETEVEQDVLADYQRISVPFFETPVKHLRVRIVDEQPMDLWGSRGVRVLEIHPWGTVRGASDYIASKTTLIIFH